MIRHDKTIQPHLKNRWAEFARAKKSHDFNYKRINWMIASVAGATALNNCA
jgi:hypothetical protein